jgi:hypothetical protein
MQLLSIGVINLNLDGTPQRVGGNPVESYGPADVAGLSHVFTGLSFACANTGNSCFFNGRSGGVTDPDRFFKPMQGYPQFDSRRKRAF